MSSILVVGVVIISGFLFGELAARVRFPKVTGYILAGILLNPGLFNLCFIFYLKRHAAKFSDIGE